MARERTACDVWADAKQKFSNPNRLTRDEVDELADNLYELLSEMHDMAEAMESRLIQYYDFVSTLKKDAEYLLP